MKIIIRKLSLIIREIVFIFRNYYYKHLFQVGSNTIFLGKVYYYHPTYINIGKNCSINEGVFFNAGTNIIIHNNVSISAGVFITSAGGYMAAKDGEIINCHDNKTVEIEDGVWIGANATILHGVKIGKGCVVAAGSVVNSDVKDGMVVAGNPARVTSKVNVVSAVIKAGC
jgi:maltose O-acetyltransferase